MCIMDSVQLGQGCFFFFRFNHPHSIHDIAYYLYIYVAPGYEAALELSLSLQRERETERERGEKKGNHLCSFGTYFVV